MLLVLSATLVELNSSPQAFHSVSTTIRETFKIIWVEHVNTSISGSTGGEPAGPQMPDPTETETEYGEYGCKNSTLIKETLSNANKRNDDFKRNRWNQNGWKDKRNVC